MCNHCPYVKAKLSEISSIQNDYKQKGVVILCINSNDEEQYPEDDADQQEQPGDNVCESMRFGLGGHDLLRGA